MGIYYENIKYLYKQDYVKTLYKCEFDCYPSYSTISRLVCITSYLLEY